MAYWALLLLLLVPVARSTPCADVDDHVVTADEVLESGFVNLKNQTVIVTGGCAQDGLGFTIAKAFARRGASVVLAAANQTACDKAADNIIDSVKGTGGWATPMALNFTSLASVRKMAEEFSSLYARLNILVNSPSDACGHLTDPRCWNPGTITEDGFETIFQAEYLGPFLLTQLLLPKLKKAADFEGFASRVINVASDWHARACEVAGYEEKCLTYLSILPPPIIPRTQVTVHYDPDATLKTNASLYGVAKLLQIQHATELMNREGSYGIQALSLTPGVVAGGPASAELCKDLDFKPCPYTLEQGAAVIAYCAMSAPDGGGYFSRPLGCEPTQVIENGMTDEDRGLLYNKSLEWCEFGPPPVPSPSSPTPRPRPDTAPTPRPVGPSPGPSPGPGPSSTPKPREPAGDNDGIGPGPFVTMLAVGGVVLCGFGFLRRRRMIRNRAGLLAQNAQNDGGLS